MSKRSILSHLVAAALLAPALALAGPSAASDHASKPSSECECAKGQPTEKAGAGGPMEEPKRERSAKQYLPNWWIEDGHGVWKRG